MTSKQKLERIVRQARAKHKEWAKYRQKESPDSWNSWSPWHLALDVAKDLGPWDRREALQMCADIPALARMKGGETGSIGERALVAVQEYIANQIVR